MFETFFELAHRLDQRLFKALYLGLRPDGSRGRDKVDHLFILLNSLGEGFMIVPVTVGLWLARTDWKQFLARILILLIGLSIGLSLVAAGKDGFKRYRPRQELGTPVSPDSPPDAIRQPPEWLSEFLHVQTIPRDPDAQWGRIYFSRSFPSGHAQYSMFLAMMVFLWYPRIGIWLILWAIGTALGRIYGGHHFPLDTLAGNFCGCAGAVLGVWLSTRLARWKVLPDPARRFLQRGLPDRWTPRTRATASARFLGVYVSVVVTWLSLAGLALWDTRGGPSLPILAFVLGTLTYLGIHRLVRPEAFPDEPLVPESP